MDKKHEQPQENNETNKVNEPAIAYSHTLPNPPCSFTDEEKIQRIEQAIKEEEEGNYITHEEIIKKYKNKL